MEASGEVGKVNTSGSTHAMLKQSFNCTRRGKIEAKNKWEIDMFSCRCRLQEPLLPKTASKILRTATNAAILQIAANTAFFEVNRNVTLAFE